MCFVLIWHLLFWRRKLLKIEILFVVRKIFLILEPCEQILKRPTQGTYLQNINFLDVIVTEKKMFKGMNVYERP
jgi:hypothetical protein